MTPQPPYGAGSSRRDFMRNGFDSLALVCTFAAQSSLKGTTSSPTTSAARRSQAAKPFAPFAVDLPIPPALKPTSTTPGRRRLRRGHPGGLAEILPGFQTPIYGYDGVYPGPTIRARKGRTTIVRQKNRLTFDSNVHLHGGYVPAAHDGHPMDVILPGKGFDYTTRTSRTRRSSGTTTTRTAARRTRSTTGSSGTTCSRTSARKSSGCRPMRVRHPAHARRPRVQQGRVVPVLGERRPRLPRATRSSSTARSRRAWRSSAGSTACGS